MKKFFSILSTCAVLSGCAAAGNSIVNGSYYYPSTTRDLWPVSIVAADDRYHANTREVYLDPGVHTLLLTSHKPPLGHLRRQQTFLVKTEACKRYYVAAQHTSPVSNDWEPVLSRIDDLPWCSADSSQSGVGAQPQPGEPAKPGK